QFVRFQKAADGTFFAAFEPMYNVLALAIPHFKDQFSDQKWIIYDLKRSYGYYYDLNTVEEITLETEATHLVSGMLDETQMAEDEKLFQEMWKTYFKSIAIKERINPKLHKQNMPVRYWKHLTEKQL
ncbi:MAG: TIGR03915 family putative DNA repair protein, partial [Bacteroides sp.]